MANLQDQYGNPQSLPQGAFDLIQQTRAIDGPSIPAPLNRQRELEAQQGYIDTNTRTSEDEISTSLSLLLSLVYGKDAPLVAQRFLINVPNVEMKKTIIKDLMRAQQIVERTQKAVDEGTMTPKERDTVVTNVKATVKKYVDPYAPINKTLTELEEVSGAYEEDVKKLAVGLDKFNKSMIEINKNLDTIDKGVQKLGEGLDVDFNRKMTPEEEKAFAKEMRERMERIVAEQPLKKGGTAKRMDSNIDGFEVNTPEQYKEIIREAASEHGVPTSTLSSLLAHESMNWNENVIKGNLDSPVGAQGIAQFMPATAASLGINPLDVHQAIKGAAQYLRQQFDMFGNWDLALAGYNAGPGAVKKYGGIPPYNETQNYVKNITERAEKARNSYVPVVPTLAPALISAESQEKEDKDESIYKKYIEPNIDDASNTIQNIFKRILESADIIPETYASEYPSARLPGRTEEKSLFQKYLSPFSKKITSPFTSAAPSVKTPMPQISMARIALKGPSTPAFSTPAQANASSISGRSVYIPPPVPKPTPRQTFVSTPQKSVRQMSGPASQKSGAYAIGTTADGRVLYSDGSKR